MAFFHDNTGRRMSRIREQFLLHRIRTRHDTEAFAEIYDVYAMRITRFIRLKVARREDAEELQAEVFERAWGTLCKARVQHLGALLYTIARRTIADHYRKMERSPQESELEAAATVDDGNDMRTEAVVQSDFAAIQSALDGLYEDYRELIVMRFMDQMTISEIAATLQKTPNSVRVGLHRAIGALKRTVRVRDE